MAKSSRPNPESAANRPDLPDLPHFGERLPLLIEALNNAGAELTVLPADGLYLQAWERLYRSAHSLKGLTKVLQCEPELGKRVIDLSDTLAAGVTGNQYIDNPQIPAPLLSQLAQCLEKGDDWENSLQALRDCYATGPDHNERLRSFKAPLPNLNPIVTKRAYCALTRKLPTWIITEAITLSQFTDWESTLGRLSLEAKPLEGLLIHCLPRLAGGGDSQVEAWGWIAAPLPDSEDMAADLQRSLPQAVVKRFAL